MTLTRMKKEISEVRIEERKTSGKPSAPFLSEEHCLLLVGKNVTTIKSTDVGRLSFTDSRSSVKYFGSIIRFVLNPLLYSLYSD